MQDPVSLAGKHVDELCGRGQRDRRPVDLEPADDVGDHLGHRSGLGPHLVRLRDDPYTAAVDDRRLGVGAADIKPDHRSHQGIMPQTLRIVPVVDLKGGIVVHARRGQRAAYEPLRSPLVDGCEPVAVARALCAACRTSTLYVADLDAIGGQPVDQATLAAVAAVAQPWVDAAATSRERAAALARAGAARNVVGTESLIAGARSLKEAALPPLVLSVDLREGRLISPDPELAGRAPAAAAPVAQELGVSELLVIDLARVGSGSGPPLDAVAELAAALPEVAIYAGGGVRGDEDLRALEAAGAAGALVATALHEGRLTPS